MNCNNCGALVEKKYCAECGQKTKTSRLDISGLIHDGWHALTHTDAGILRLLKDILLQPKTFYTNYFSGQRKKYFSPVLFFILTAGLVALLYDYVFVYQDKIFNTNNEFGKIVYHQTKFKALIILPFQVLLTWLAFRKSYNLAEIIVFWLFSLGLTYCIRIVFIPFYYPFIAYKDEIDITMFYTAQLIILWQGCSVFGRNILNMIIFFIIINISIVLDLVASIYILFGSKIFDNPLGIKTWWDLIKRAY